MAQTVDIRPGDLAIVQQILRDALPPDVKVWVFGSRAKWTTKDSSDLDLAIDAGRKLLRGESIELDTAFEESDLPYKVDVVDWHSVADSFKAVIERDRVALPRWQKAKLKDICVPKIGIQTGPFGSQLHQKDYVESGTPIITVEHLADNRITHQNLPRVADHDRDRLIKYTLQKGDIVFSRVGSVDRRALVRENEDGWMFSGRCLRVRVDKEKACPAFLAFQFGTESFKEHIRSIAVGATMPSINTTILSDIDIVFPPLNDQKAIANVLSALDDKIELNRQMNATLEEMARALFKSWFVDFDPVRAKMEGRTPDGLSPDLAALFPDTLVDSPLGPIPEGWEVKPLDQIIELIGGGTPKTAIDEYWNGDIPWFSIADAPLETDVFVIDTEKHISQSGLESSSANILPVGTTIVTARGTVGKIALTAAPMAMNQSCYGIRGIHGDCYWTFFQIKGALERLKQRSHGSVFDTITRSTFSSIQVPNPNRFLVLEFDSAVSPIFQKIKTNLLKNRSLKLTRDTLLPKLISGELRVADAANKSSFLNKGGEYVALD